MVFTTHEWLAVKRAACADTSCGVSVGSSVSASRASSSCSATNYPSRKCRTYSSRVSVEYAWWRSR